MVRRIKIKINIGFISLFCVFSFIGTFNFGLTQLGTANFISIDAALALATL
jgi:hypothetical protein